MMDITSSENFLEMLDLRLFKDDHEKAVCSLNFMEKIITETECQELSFVLNSIKNFSALIKAKLPMETIPRNMAIRILKIIEDEYYTVKHKTTLTESEHLKIVMSNVLDVLQELKAEYEQCQEMICDQSRNMFHSNEIILTNGYCPSTLEFLIRAAKSRKFHVIIADSTTGKGQLMAKRISTAGIQTTLIEDKAIYGIMSRINKVIIGCKAVFSDGGMKSAVGTNFICLAAHQFAIPVYVCTPTYKFSVSETPKAGEFVLLETGDSEGMKCISALQDIVCPQHIEAFITNERIIAPSHVYRQLKKSCFPHSRDIYQMAVSSEDS